ncbi:MAG: hypothetical protein AB1478_10555 [Nitrospirota bacterium]
MKIYEVLYYDGWGHIPAYYLIDSAKGETPEHALKENLVRITSKVRKLFNLNGEEISDGKIHESIYVLKETGLVSVRDLCPQMKQL